LLHAKALDSDVAANQDAELIQNLPDSNLEDCAPPPPLRLPEAPPAPPVFLRRLWLALPFLDLHIYKGQNKRHGHRSLTAQPLNLLILGPPDLSGFGAQEIASLRFEPYLTIPVTDPATGVTTTHTSWKVV
jgi:hypothetical protein